MKEGQKVLIKVKTFNELGREPKKNTHFWMEYFSKHIGKEIAATIKVDMLGEFFLQWPDIQPLGFDLTWVDIIKEDI